MRVEHLIPTQEHHAHSKVKPPVPLEINAATSSIANVVVRNVSWVGTGDAESVVAADVAGTAAGRINVSNVVLERLSFDGQVAKDEGDAHLNVTGFVWNVTLLQ